MPWKTRPALTAILTPQQQIDELKQAVATLQQRNADLVTALEADLAHAETGVTEATARIATADDKQHQREIVTYNEGWRDCLKRQFDRAKQVLA